MRVIHNGVDVATFYPRDRLAARERLGLPLGVPIVLFGAHNFVTDQKKGFDLFRQAVARQTEKQWHCVLYGNSTREVPSQGMEGRVTALGIVKDDNEMAAIYSCADVFVAPSREEGFGKTLVESMACGTPVVAFNATGPRDIVLHRETGYLAKPFEPAELAAGIAWVIEESRSSETLRANARRRAVTHFAIETVAARYMDLYSEILSEARVGCARVR